MNRTLPVMEIFYSLQGEGMMCGRAAHFVRLGGCSVHCPWCDVKQSWGVSSHPQMSVTQIVENVVAEGGARTVVITGGEPLMHDLTQLCAAFKEQGFEILLETSGSDNFSGSFDWICLSPKRHKMPVRDAFTFCNELKVVISGDDDFAFAEECAQRTSPECVLLLQCEWGARAEVAAKIVDYIKQNPKWRLSLQTHKYLMIP